MFDLKVTGLLSFALRLKENPFVSGYFSLSVVLFGCRKKAIIYYKSWLWNMEVGS